MTSILLIDDDPHLQIRLARILEEAGYLVFVASNGQDGLDRLDRLDLDAIIVGFDLPDMRGDSVVKAFRDAGVDTPALILSRSNEPAKIVRCLRIGADDYLTNPFSVGELLARVSAVMRRSNRLTEQVLQVGELSINLADKTVEALGARLRLTRKEFDLLEVFASSVSVTVHKHTLKIRLYSDFDELATEQSLKVLVCRLRNKLRDATGYEYLETIRGAGYRMRDPRSRNLGRASEQRSGGPA